MSRIYRNAQQPNEIAVILLGLLASLCITSARAQRPAAPPRLVLQALDTDHDGKLSGSELQAAPQSLLKLDRNVDGMLTADELQPRPENAGASATELVTQIMSFDKNGDGVLTPDEMPTRMQSIFQRGDANHDGKLTADEIRTMAERQGMPAGGPANASNIATRMDPLLNALDADHNGVISAEEIALAGKSLLVLDRNGDGEITADEMRVRQQTPQERVDHLLEEWDTNKDGKLAKSEVPDRMQQQFESIDKNGDGILNRDELLQYFGTMDAAPRGVGKRSDDSGRQTGASPTDIIKEPK